MSAVIVKALWIYGLAAVVSMVIAAVIKAIVVLLNLFERRQQPAVAAVLQPAAVAGPTATVDIAADHIAAIGAAVYAAIGAHRIVRIDDSRGGTGWTAEGRLAHHASHAMPAHTQKR